jgi:hypothetical protein
LIRSQNEKICGDIVKLEKEDADLFYKLNWSLLFYVNQEYPFIEGLNEPFLRYAKPEKIMEL